MRSPVSGSGQRRGLLDRLRGPRRIGQDDPAQAVQDVAEIEGYDVVTTKWNSSDLIKPIIKSPQGSRIARARRSSRCSTRADFRHRVEQVILPALWAGKLVIADRFLFTGLAARRRARPRSRLGAQAVPSRCIWPDIVFYFSVSPTTSGQARHGDPDAETSTRPARTSPASRRSGRELPAVHRARHSRVRIAGADLSTSSRIDAEQSIGDQHLAIRRLFLEGRERPWSHWNVDASPDWLASRRAGDR